MRIQIQSDLLRFLGSESPREIKRLVGLSIFVGIVNTTLIGLINAAAKEVTDGNSVTLEFFLFALLLVFFMLIARRSNQENIQSTQDLIFRFRMRILRDVFESNLAKIDEIGRHYIIEVMARDTQMVSQSVVTVVTVFQSIATLFFLTIYMATVSMTAFFVILVSSALIFIGGVIELFRVTDQFGIVAQRENEVNALFADFLNGFKEIKMNSHRAFDITRDAVDQATHVSEIKSALIISITNFFNYLQVLLYVVVGIMVFVVPILSDDFADHVTAAATTALFLAGSLAGIITSIPNLTQANVAARALQGLADKLEIKEPAVGQPQGEVRSDVSTIGLSNVTYEHIGPNSLKRFVLGPINAVFERGKVYFIRGNNGSGKTTLIRILTGLYQPHSGQILVNGQPIPLPASSGYRDLFAAVFSDFYLFKKLYGVSSVPEQEIYDLIEQFKMTGKVTVQDGAFSDLQFSTGQRKRIALIVALLEKKQFMILDEWAADQDPEFRKEFYEQIIPKLREMGKTVIAITHDDRYYEMADHVLYMTDGSLTTI